ncbi:hypothetical protein [Streptomyces sp. NPDC059631]|uniref:hypothetical protein n=1 Tax=unclassified Streptomyces TaxID=2593676 RepID=UPI0036B14349
MIYNRKDAPRPGGVPRAASRTPRGLLPLPAQLALPALPADDHTTALRRLPAPVAHSVGQRIIDASELDIRLILRELRNTARVARDSVNEDGASDLASAGDLVRRIVGEAREAAPRTAEQLA